MRPVSKDRSSPRSPYHVRADWVWNRTTNSGLTGTATLLVRLTHPEANVARERFDLWLADSGAKAAGAEGPYLRGGCSIVVVTRDSSSVEVLLSSRGQDALESLDDLVRRLQKALLRADDPMLASWTELPIEKGKKAAP